MLRFNSDLLSRILVRACIELQEDILAQEVEIGLESGRTVTGPEPRRDGTVGESVDKTEEGQGHGELLVTRLDLVQLHLDAARLRMRV